MSVGLLMRRRATGSIIPPEPVVFYEWLVGDGNAYIVTDYFPMASDAMSCRSVKTKSSTSEMLFGARTASASFLLLLTDANDFVYFAPFAANSVGMKVGGSFINSEREYYHADFAAVYNGVRLATLTNTSIDKPLHIFASNVADGSDAIDARIFSGKIGEVKVRRGDDLIHHYRPAFYQNKAGMYDVITGKFLTNTSSSGTFSLE